MRGLELTFFVFSLSACASSGFSGDNATKAPKKEAPPAQISQNSAESRAENSKKAKTTPKPPESTTQETKKPANAIKQGSFTVWADPADPVPQQPYFIYIEVDLPTKVTSYTYQDLTGNVTGTDGYQQFLGQGDPVTGAPQKFFFKTGKARMILYVPGADQNVRDTVEVFSNLLNERQVIHILF
jgi:hypothetical protein